MKSVILGIIVMAAISILAAYGLDGQFSQTASDAFQSEGNVRLGE